MTRRSGRSSEGRKRTKAAKETVLACMERWTSLVKVNETKVNEKQKGTSVANIFTNTTLIKKYRLEEDVEHRKENGFKRGEKKARVKKPFKNLGETEESGGTGSVSVSTEYGDNNGRKASHLHLRGSECSNRSRVAMTNRQVP
jgi:hypothetical protein